MHKARDCQYPYIEMPLRSANILRGIIHVLKLSNDLHRLEDQDSIPQRNCMLKRRVDFKHGV